MKRAGCRGLAALCIVPLIADVAATAVTSAADLPGPAAVPPPAPYVPTVAPVYNWGGVYFGINGGYALGESEWATTALGSTGQFNTTGFAFGGTVGANYQLDAFVFGIEGDVDYMGIDGRSTAATPCSNDSFVCETKQTWLSTFRVRAGYAADRVLFYGTAGGVYGNIQAGAAGSTLTVKNEPGWTAGAGIEGALTESVTLRAEYLFVQMENATPFSLPITGTAVTPVTIKLNENLIRLGVDYKFR